MQVDWELSQQFVSDSQGIRAVCSLPSDYEVDSLKLITGNQGGGLCEFGVPSGALNPIAYQHNHAITAILSDSNSDNSHYITGCKDGIIRVFNGKTHDLETTLTGHEKPVTSLSFASTKVDDAGQSKQYLLSGSWDGTAKVWDISRNAMVATLPGHENSVCVVGLENNDADTDASILRIATGSAGEAQGNQISGYSVRIWTVNVKTGQVICTKTVANDHQGPIRDIALLPGGAGIATCSNDGTVKLRTADTGDSLSTLTFLQQQQQHPPMLLSVTSLQQGYIAAGAEDGHVIIWTLEGDAEPKVLLHPACVWNVFGLPNGDLVTCCQDGTLRIFTTATDRMAPVAEREQFAQLVQEAHKKQSSGPSPEEIAKLPLWEQNLQKRGSSEGQVQLFNKGGIAIAAQWSMASQTWIEVGQVMGSSDGGTVDGVSYDHVLPIEVDQTGGGVAKLQLGYNNGENPFVAAQRFIDTYQLPQYHLSQIADYIQQRVGSEAPTIGMGGAGAAAASGFTPVAAAGTPMVSYQHLPMTAYKSFELPAKAATTTLEKMKTKIQEAGKLSDSQVASLSSLIDTLGATNRYHATKIDATELAVITTLLDALPPAEVFPALDLARLTVVHPDAASTTNTAFWSNVMVKAIALCANEDVNSVAVPMLSLRLFANAFRAGPGSKEAVSALLGDILSTTIKFIPAKNKNVRLSVATLLYNISFYFHSQQQSQGVRPEFAQELVGAIDKILRVKTYESEAITRSLIALGTAVLASKDAKDAAKAIHVVSLVEMSASPHGDIAKAVAKEVYNVLA